jgi:hypothetical protein
MIPLEQICFLVTVFVSIVGMIIASTIEDIHRLGYTAIIGALLFIATYLGG